MGRVPQRADATAAAASKPGAAGAAPAQPLDAVAYLHPPPNPAAIVSQASSGMESSSFWVIFKPVQLPLAALALSLRAWGNLSQTPICLNLLIATPTPKPGTR